MSRVHDALRRAEQAGFSAPPAARTPILGAEAADHLPRLWIRAPTWRGLLERIEEDSFRTATDSAVDR